MAPALLAANGAPIKVVLGYVSTARVLLALEQGEIDGSSPSAMRSRAGRISSARWCRSCRREPRPGVPQLRDVVRESHRPILDLVTAPDSIGVPLAGMPAEATAILRKAFLAMAQDKAYQADAEKVELPIGTPISGSQLAEMMRALAASTTPEVIAAFGRLAGSNRRMPLKLVLPERIELSTSPLPRECSTTELRQRRAADVAKLAPRSRVCGNAQKACHGPAAPQRRPC